MQELKDILNKLGIAPASGYGEVVIEYYDREITFIETHNRQMSKNIN